MNISRPSGIGFFLSQDGEIIMMGTTQRRQLSPKVCITFERAPRCVNCFIFLYESGVNIVNDFILHVIKLRNSLGTAAIALLYIECAMVWVL